MDARGLSLLVAVTGLPQDPTFTSQPTSGGEPILVVYTAADGADNSISVTRQLLVVDKCTEGDPKEKTCKVDSVTCRKCDCGLSDSVTHQLVVVVECMHAWKQARSKTAYRGVMV